jgi:hypothetical protein
MVWYSESSDLQGGIVIPRPLLLLVAVLFVAGPLAAQSASLGDGTTDDESSSLSAPAGVPSDPSTNFANGSPAAYVSPSEEQKRQDFAWDAVGPVAFAGSAFAAVIDQGFDFPHAWGQGEDAYTVRVASNLGIAG